MAIRYHLDEHVHPGIAAGLRSRGIDVTTTTDAGLISSGDDKQIAFAQRKHRVLVTHDRDFLQYHSASVEHSGIAYSHQDKYSVGELLRMLLLLHACYESEEMTGKIEFL